MEALFSDSDHPCDMAIDGHGSFSIKISGERAFDNIMDMFELLIVVHELR